MAIAYNTSIVRNDLVLYLDAANPKSYTGVTGSTLLLDSDFNSWFKAGGVTITSTTEVAPDSTNTATTLQDSSNTSFQWISKTITIPNDNQTYNFTIYVKKTTGNTAPGFGVNISLSGGTAVAQNARLNTDTGVAVVGSSTGTSVVGDGDYWKLLWNITNNRTGNVNLSVSIYPAARVPGGTVDTVTATGSATIWGFQIDNNPVWYDISGNNRNGILVNSPTYSTENNGILSFDGINDYVGLPMVNTFLANNDIYTASCWINYPTSTNALQFIWGQTDQNGFGDNNTIFEFNLNYVTNRISFVTGTNPATSLPFNTIFQQNTWYNIAAIKNAGALDLYVNGVFDRGITNANTGSSTGTVHNIGKPLSNERYFNGKFSNGLIYNRVLSAQEILRNFNSLRGRYGV